MSIFDEHEDLEVIKSSLKNVKDEDIPGLLQAWHDAFIDFIHNPQHQIINIRLLQIFREIQPNKHLFEHNDKLIVANSLIFKDLVSCWVNTLLQTDYIMTTDDFEAFVIGVLSIDDKLFRKIQNGNFKQSYTIFKNGEDINIESKYQYYISAINILKNEMINGKV